MKRKMDVAASDLKPGDMVVRVGYWMTVEREVTVAPFVPNPEVWRVLDTIDDPGRASRNIIAVRDSEPYRWTYYARKDED